MIASSKSRSSTRATASTSFQRETAFSCRLYALAALTFPGHAGRIDEEENDGRCERSTPSASRAGTVRRPRGRRARPDGLGPATAPVTERAKLSQRRTFSEPGEE